jgi:hypothetical protein
MGTVAVFRKDGKEASMKKLGMWVKVKSALGSCQLRFDVSRFTDESKAEMTPLMSRVTLPCTKFAQNLHRFSLSLSLQLHEQMSCWIQGHNAMHCGLDPE